MQMLLGAVQGGYRLLRSLRFRASASAYLNRTFGTPTNNKIWTISSWVKRGAIASGALQSLFVANAGGANYWGLSFTTTDNLYIFDGFNATSTVQTTAVYRDPAAWYHIVVAVDTTQATASNRFKLYVNGTQVTAFSTATYPTQNTNTQWNTSSGVCSIGRDQQNGRYFDGYLAEVNFIDGQALTPSSFGSTNALTGVWQPAKYTGTYGTNGFYLPFTDNSTAAALGTDFSGNGNTWTVNNISVTAGVTYDSMTDVPTLTSAAAANYAVLNPLNKDSQPTITNGNLTVSMGVASGGWRTVPSTIAMPSGKWYAEVVFSAIQGSASASVGIAAATTSFQGLVYPGLTSTSYGYFNNGDKTTNNVGVAYGATWTTGDVLGIAFDGTAGTLTFYKNNTSQGTAFTSISAANQYYFIVGGANVTNTCDVNFGQRPFAYTPPTGFVALNTFNLPASTIVKGNTVMDATLYTGTGAALSVTNAAGFQPDLVWVKSRSNATDHRLTDSVRGVTLSLATNSTNNEVTNAQGLTAFNSNGFTLGTDADYNGSARTFVGWQWQAGQGSSSSNTSGTITSQVSVNAAAGFSVATFTTPGGYTNATIGHGLGVAPAMYIVKNRSGSVINWITYHQSLGNTQALYMNGTNAAVTSSTFWNNTSPTSSVFSIGSNLFASQTYVAYCWSEIAGFSKFGSYTGNGSADGTFVYTGFRPAFVMIKSTSTGGWVLLDTARDSFNVANKYLYAQSFGAEASGSAILDITSNGFKLRTTWTDVNGSGTSYVYMAFAENPFKNSLAR